MVLDRAFAPVVVAHGSKGPVQQSPSQWLARHRGIESVVFDASLPQVIEDAVARAQGIVPHAGARTLNRYMPARQELGDAAAAGPFVDHVRRLIPDKKDADHVLAWLAHRVQKPGEKVRHALVLGGPQGVGKDTIIDAVVPALGAWNVSSIDPDAVLRPFNEHAASVLVRINEVANLHDLSRYKFYEATKTLIAGGPDWTEVNPKYGRKYHVRSTCGVVMTTNYIGSGLYLPPDDRRHFVVETVEGGELWATPEDREAYFEGLWGWLLGGGFAHVAAWLHAHSLAGWTPNAPPPKTSSFAQVVANSAGSDGWLLDALGELGEPDMVRADRLREIVMAKGEVSGAEFSKRLLVAMTRLGYESWWNPHVADGRHRLTGDKKVAVYLRRGLSRTKPYAELAAMLKALDAF